MARKNYTPLLFWSINHTNQGKKPGFTSQRFKRLLFSVLSILLLLGGAKAQTYPAPNYPDPMVQINKTVRQLYQPILPYISSPIFYNMGVGVVDSLYHRPILNNSLYGSTDIWYRSYEQFRQATIDTTGITPLPELINEVYKNAKDTIPLLILARNYKYISDTTFSLDSAHNPFGIDTVNEQLTIRDYSLFQAKLKSSFCFMVTPAYEDLTRPKFVFKFDPQFFFVDTDLAQYFQDLGGIKIKVTPTDSFAITNFTTVQYFTIDRTETIIDTLIRFSARVQKTGSSPYALHRIAAQISNPSLTSADLASVVFNRPGLKATKYPACVNANFKRALIYVEGIDIMDQMKGKNREARDIYIYEIYKKKLSLLRSQGYDIWIVDWAQSTISMKDNAQYLASFIQYLNEEVYQGDELEPMVMIGESMGGVISRNALLIMEKEAEELNDLSKLHNVRTLITVDSPHKGAHIPMAFQLAYTVLRPLAYAYLGITTIADGVVNTISWWGNHDINLGAQQLTNILGKPAVKELLISHISGNESNGLRMEHQERVEYIQYLEGLGNYPKYCKMIATTNGSLKGNGQKSILTGDEPNGSNLFNANVGVYFRILGIQFKVFGVGNTLKINSGSSDGVLDFSVGFYKPKFRFQRLRLIVKSTYVPIITITPPGIPAPTLCNKAGGYQTYIQSISALDEPEKKNIFDRWWFPLTIDSDRESNECYKKYTVGINAFGLAGMGLQGELCSSAPNWNFIPVESAIDDINGFSSNFTTNYWAMNIQDKLNRTPFDAIMGPDFAFSLGTLNEYHLNIPNANLVPYFEECKNLKDGYFLNKEIGGKNIWINNWTIPNNPNLHILNSIENKVMYFDYTSQSAYLDVYKYNWETPNVPYNANRTYGLYSKDELARTIDAGSVRLVYKTDKIDKDPISGELIIQMGPAAYTEETNTEVDHCCVENETYAVRKPSQPLAATDCNFPILAYPNPKNSDNLLRIKYFENNEITSVEMFDLVGNCIATNLSIDSKSYLVNVPNKLKGVYLLRIHSTNCTYIQKLIIQ